MEAGCRQRAGGQTRLLSFLRRHVEDERVVQHIKRFLKSGVMEDGVVMETEEGSPQGGPLSPLLANIYPHVYLKAMETPENENEESDEDGYPGAVCIYGGE